jgi:hypothetical protein
MRGPDDESIALNRACKSSRIPDRVTTSYLFPSMAHRYAFYADNPAPGVPRAAPPPHIAGRFGEILRGSIALRHHAGPVDPALRVVGRMRRIPTFLAGRDTW